MRSSSSARTLAGAGGVQALAAGLMAAVLLVLGALAWQERLQLHERIEERNTLLASVFADQAARSVDMAALAAAATAEALQRGAAPTGTEVLAGLQQTLVNLPFLRGIAVLDASGLVLASASPGEAGLRLDTQRLGPLPAPGRDALGRFLPLRQLRELAAPPAGAAAPAGVGVLPLLRGTTLGGRERATVIALVNPAAFAGLVQATLGNEATAAALLSWDGQLLAATVAVPQAPGTTLATLAPFTRSLPQREAGSWVGAGLRGGEQLAAFRMAATRPLVAVVEHAGSAADAAWLRRCRLLAAAALGAAVLVLAGTRLVLRNMRAREAARAEREAARRERDAAQARATQRVQAQLAFNRQLLEVSPLPVSVAGPEGRCVMVNAAWESFHGRRRDEVIGRALHAHLPGAEQRVHEAYDRLLRRQRDPLRYEATLTAGDGLPHDVVVNKLLVPGEDGQAEGVLSVTVDVTEFRNAERATREARDSAEESSRVKSEFIANISHELRTPLQAIIGFSELGAHRGRESPKLAAMFQDIHGAGQRMLALVNDLLDVAKIESTVGTIHLERADLRGLAREAVRELQPLLAARQLHVAMTLPEQPLRAKVDPLRIQQVLRNVLANAIKFSPPGAAIELRGETQGEELHLSIADRGPGIPAAELEKIFEAFVQSSQTKDGSGGTGLGLAICRKIVLAHGGRIQASNRNGGGAIFHLWLPARGAGETQPLPL